MIEPFRERRLRDRLARILEECTTKRGLEPPRSIASWEYEALLTWRDRDTLEMTAAEVDMLASIERLVLGRVR